MKIASAILYWRQLNVVQTDPALLDIGRINEVTSALSEIQDAAGLET